MWSDDGQWWWDGYRWVPAQERHRQLLAMQHRVTRADLLIPIGGFLLVPAIAVLVFIVALIVGAVHG